MTIPEFEEIVEQNDQTEARREHLDKLRELVGNVYPNKFARSSISGAEDTIAGLLKFEPVVAAGDEMAAVKATMKEGERPPAEVKDKLNEQLKALGTVRIAGRLTTPPRGNFVHLTDGISKLQIYCDKKGGFGLVKNDAENTVDPENGWTAWKLIDHGDFVGVEGYLFVTNTGEVSLHVEKLQFLAKAMVPMPDKMHGIADPEIRQRRRYADLIASSLQVETEGLTTREVFETRAKVISSLRRYLEDHGYIEVETPMLTPKATGAAAKPFVTHHNALDIELYARIAPELYLKRLVVGGFEKVYELNRNFRNEGISFKHNPEFTMLEFYCAYMDVNGMMDFCEELLRHAVQKATNGLVANVRQVRGKEPIYVPEYRGSRSMPRAEEGLVYEETINVFDQSIDFSRFHRMTMKDAVINHSRLAHSLIGGDIGAWLEIGANVSTLNRFFWWFENDLGDDVYLFDESGNISGQIPPEKFDRIIEAKWREITAENEGQVLSEAEKSLSLLAFFEEFVEPELIQPTFIVDYPKSISPLSKASPANPQIAERFELFINGMEVANGFSELNDPKEQYDRFVDQMSERERGDEEAMVLDEDYVRALGYGMPPAAGIGIGIDRLVMLLTNKHSIRDVILFPHLRPERRAEEKLDEATDETGG